MNLLNCAACASLPLRALPIINKDLTRLYPLQQALCAPLSFLLTNTVVSVGNHAKKKKYSNKRPWIHAKMRIFSFRPETRFLGKLGRKIIKTVSLNWNLAARPIRIWKVQWWCSLVHFSHFQPAIPFSGKFHPKKQNCQSELKFSTYTYLIMQNSMAMFTFSIFDRKDIFWGKFGPKKVSYQFELKFDT